MKKFACRLLVLSCFLCLPGLAQHSYAQGDPLLTARTYMDSKAYDKAYDILKKLYEETPGDADVYKSYLTVLLELKNYKDAEKLVMTQAAAQPFNPLFLIDMGQVYARWGKDKKATEQFDKAIGTINGDDMRTQQIATAFGSIGNDDYAIRAYERAGEILRTNYLYSTPLSRLYYKTGNLEKAVSTLIENAPGRVDDIKAILLEYAGTDPKKLQTTQKTIIRYINQQPENPFFAELLTWIYTQRGDWDGALLQIQALDERLNEQGKRLLEFAQVALKEKQYDIALKSLDGILTQGREKPYYAQAKAQRLSLKARQLTENPDYKPADIAALTKEYADFLDEFPQYNTTFTIREYARLEALYAHNPDKAVSILQTKALVPAAGKEFIGWSKLDMGDYQVIAGKIWDASLTYSQVDKAFREDMLGEEARFRNARLSYFRGDFDWAQGQLSVLKASTSELIANDALHLSVLITENIPPDSNLVPLQRFAYADLLLFQNKDQEAEALLDSIYTAFPKHPLQDDILMQRALIAEKHGDYTKALGYLQQVYEQFGKDVLADDAIYKTADLYENRLHDNKQAQTFYEKLILEFPGSTYVQSARERLKNLQDQAGKQIP